jgi:hypothetical protein
MAAGQGQPRADVELWLDETAALTLQTVMLQALVSNGVLTHRGHWKSWIRAVDAIMDTPDGEEVDEIAEVAHACLEQVRECLQSDLPTCQ